ncbi:MAG: phage tail assembly protein T [bacterium]
MTVADLLGRISSRELAEWMAYERAFGPLGGERGDYQAALVAQTVANANRGKKQRVRKLSDFLLRWSRQRQSPQQQLEIMRRVVARAGGTVSRGDDR